MTCRVIGLTARKLALQLSYFGDKCAATDDQYMDNLRLFVAAFLAKYADEGEISYDVDRKLGDLADTLMTEAMHERGRIKVVVGGKESMWMYGYVNHTRVTSEWAKKTFPGCTVQITARIIELVGNFENVTDAHTLVIYF